MFLKYYIFGLLGFLGSSLLRVNANSLNSTHVNILKEDLMKDYYADTIPTNNKPINLSIGLAIRAFNNIDQKEGTIELNVWLRYWWTDYNLRWNKTKWNISTINFNTDGSDNSIWIPDIFLYNTGEVPLENLKFSNAVVSSNGGVLWSRPGLIKSTCSFDMTDFPYDTQKCEIKLGSWSYTGYQLVLTEHEPTIDLENYQNNEEWELKNVDYIINAIKYACCPHKYYDITFKYDLKRLSGYYENNIIIPTFATASLILVTLLIPWKSGERISFAVTVMLSIIVFLLILSDTLPKSNQRPLLSTMITSLTFFSLFGVFFTVFITALNDYKDENLTGKSEIENKFIACLVWICDKIGVCKRKTKKMDDKDVSSDTSTDDLTKKVEETGFEHNNNRVEQNVDYNPNQEFNLVCNILEDKKVKVIDGVSSELMDRTDSYNIANQHNTLRNRNSNSNKCTTIIQSGSTLTFETDDNSMTEEEKEKNKLLIEQCETMITYFENIYGTCFFIVFISLCLVMIVARVDYNSN